MESSDETVSIQNVALPSFDRACLHRKVLQKTPVLAMHPNCVRTEEPILVYDLTTIDNFQGMRQSARLFS
jgi:hypothetical protein